MNKSYNEWDKLENFHKRISTNTQLEIKGVNSFLEISKFAKKLELKVPRHPTINVRFESNMHYDWLIRINKIIKIISEIPNYEPRIKSFFNSDDYFDSLSALYELEMALKFKLQGFEVSFTEEKAPDKKPDLEIELDGIIFNLEVTSINNPDEDREKQEFYSQLTKLRLKYKVKMAGILIDVPKKTHKNLLQNIEDRIIEIEEKREIIRLNEQGKYILEIGPTAGIGLSTTGFQFVHKELKDIEDKVNQIIQKKNDQLRVNQNPGILCIYSGNRTFNIGNLYTKTYDKIYPYLQTFSNVAALVLSLYSDFYPSESLDHLKPRNKSKRLCVLKPGFGEVEQSIIWKNNIASHGLPHEFIKAYESFNQEISLI